MSFVRFMCSAHLRHLNVGLYAHGDHAQLAAEVVGTGRWLSAKVFPTEDAAVEWYLSLPGSGLGRLQNALLRLIDPDAFERFMADPEAAP